jgi:hypothetical protein
LNEEETIEALKWFESEGFPLGNLEGNLKKMYMNSKAGGSDIADTHQGKGSIHEYMRTHRMEPDTKQKEYKQIAKLFEGKSLNERLPMYTNYLRYVQGDLQEKLQVPTDYTTLDTRESSTGKIQSGPRAGERMPTNRSTLGLDPDELARRGQINFQGEELLGQLQGRPGLRQAGRFLGKIADVPLLGGAIAAGGTLLAGGGAGEAVAAGIDAENPVDAGPVASADLSYPQQVAQHFDEKRGRIQSRIDRLRKRGRTLQAQQAEEELSAVPSGAINTP